LHADHVVKQAPGVELASLEVVKQSFELLIFSPGLNFEQTFLTVLLLFNFKLKIICICFVGKN
jgi:hypothetical protein